MKPHIWLDNAFDPGWLCAYICGEMSDEIGWGVTAEEAYFDWKAKNNK